VSAGELAALIVAIASVVIAVIVTAAVLSLLRTLRTARMAMNELTKVASAAAAEVHRSATAVNHELVRVDTILERTESITHNVDATTSLTYRLLAWPMIKLIALGTAIGRLFGRRRKRSR